MIDRYEYLNVHVQKPGFSRLLSYSLYVSQPLLSHQIAELERQLGVVTLFICSQHSVQLTPARMALAQEARSILEQVNKVGPLVQRTASFP